MKRPAWLALGAVAAAACASGRTTTGASTAANSAAAPSTSPSPTPGANPAAAPVASPAANSAPASAAPAAVESLSEDEGALLYATACTSCHTGEFVAGSRISAKGWTGEVAKMRKWGALVDEEQAAPLAAWLAQKYPAAEQPPAADSMTAAAARATVKLEGQARRGNAEAGGKVFAQACASCHGGAALGLGGGPSLVENPVVQQPGRFAQLVRNGKGRMPGFNDITAAQLDDMRAWLTRAR